jgi:hypothetical protein
MVDSYVREHDLAIYGNHAVAGLRAFGSDHPALRAVVEDLERATREVARLVDDLVRARIRVENTTKTKNEAAAEAQRILTTVHFWLKLHPEIHPSEFFPKGRAAAHGRPNHVKLSLDLCAEAFQQHASISEAKTRRLDVEKIARRLADAITTHDEAQRALSDVRSALAGARRRWSPAYATAKLMAAVIYRRDLPDHDVTRFLKDTFLDVALRRRRARKRATADVTVPQEPVAPAPGS